MLPPLLFQAIDVLEAGYPAAACTLGIAMVDSLLRRTHRQGFTYPKLRNRSLRRDLDTAVTLNELRVELAWRPMHSLLQEYRPNSGKPAPKMASRHRVTHWADLEHLSQQNAIVILMVATSLFLGLAESQAIADEIGNSA
ncbi:hypothetical protein DSM43518_02993 [Mycobacterium marinum]|nr:hypothetical protein DSM43518_02993 [Mycobacterium marinum]